MVHKSWRDVEAICSENLSRRFGGQESKQAIFNFSSPKSSSEKRLLAKYFGVRGPPEAASLKNLSGFVSRWVSFDPRCGDFGFVLAYFEHEHDFWLRLRRVRGDAG
jgi:hypothetical protein